MANNSLHLLINNVTKNMETDRQLQDTKDFYEKWNVMEYQLQVHSVLLGMLYSALILALIVVLCCKRRKIGTWYRSVKSSLLWPGRFTRALCCTDDGYVDKDQDADEENGGRIIEDIDNTTS